MNTQLKKTSYVSAIATCSIGIWASAGLRLHQAQAMPPLAQIDSAIQFTPPPPPPDRGAPGNRGGGAGRGCGAGKESLIGLMPEYRQALAQGTITKVWGITTTPHPTLWFYIPYNHATIASLEFVLQDSSKPVKTIYRSEIAPPIAPGIVQMQVPTTAPALEPGKLYEWFLKVRLQCGAPTAAAKPNLQKEEINGWIQRVDLNSTLSAQLNQATPQQRAALYAQQGIWIDALATLADLRLTTPHDTRLANDWHRLLQSVALESFSTKPLIPCCQPKP
jgi:hypothetical protein